MSEDDCTEGPTSSSENDATSTIFDRLKQPILSELSRKRKIHSNPPPVGRKKSVTQQKKYDPQSIQPGQRVREFPGEQLCVSAGKLFCEACREIVGVKRSVLQGHLKSKKHEQSKQDLKKKQAREQDIADALVAHDRETHRKGETLPPEQNVYRARVLIAFMKSGIPIGKLDCPELKSLLEENGHRLTDKRHMLDMVPFVLDQEREQIREEVKGKHVSVIFDGTTRLGEVLAIVVRYMDDWKIKQRLVRLEFLQKSMNSDELARELINTLMNMLSIGTNMLLACMHDRASVNTAALTIVQVVYPQALNIGCMSHALDSVGDKFSIPNLHQFTTLWISLFSHSPKVKAL